MAGQYPPNRNSSITSAREVGRIVRDLMQEIDLPGINSNFVSLSGGKSYVTPGPSGIQSTAVFSLPANQYTIVLVTPVTGTDPMDYLILSVVARHPNGLPFKLPLGEGSANPGQMFYTWYVNAGNLYIRIWNGREAMEAKVWYI